MSNFYGITTSILSLGFIIFIHELGHFLIAKRCGIKVEKFSIGFGPRLFGFTRGGTDYRISLIPLGGYVAMSGENPAERQSAPRVILPGNPTGDFNLAPISHRIAVVIAGPVANFLLAVIIFTIVYLIGLTPTTVRILGLLASEPIDMNDKITQVGLVATDGPAAIGGIMPGDQILALNKQKIRSWQDFNTRILTSPEKPMTLDILRDGHAKTLIVTPETYDQKGLGKVGRLKASRRQSVIIGAVAGNSLAEGYSLKTGQLVRSLNGEKLYAVPDFSQTTWQQNEWFSTAQRKFYGRIEEAQKLSLELISEEKNQPTTTTTIEMPFDPAVTMLVAPESPATKIGFANNDQLIAFDGQPIDSSNLSYKLDKLTTRTEPIRLTILRNGKTQLELEVPAIGHGESGDVAEKSDFGLSWKILLSGIEFGSPPMKIPSYGPMGALTKGIDTNFAVISTVLVTLKRLLTHEISPKFMSGPIGIVDVTTQAAKNGFTSLLIFVGFISVNLGIINLLPIPIADGGQIVFFLLEWFRGKPVSLRKQVLIQQVSIVLMIGLFIYVTGFDIWRLING